MRIKSIEGKEIYLSRKEICITWFLMTGMKPKEASEIMNMTEASFNKSKKNLMAKIRAKYYCRFLLWFLTNRDEFMNEKIERLILKRDGLI